MRNRVHIWRVDGSDDDGSYDENAVAPAESRRRDLLSLDAFVAEDAARREMRQALARIELAPYHVQIACWLPPPQVVG